jgi:hypothetical protein
MKIADLHLNPEEEKKIRKFKEGLQLLGLSIALLVGTIVASKAADFIAHHK